MRAGQKNRETLTSSESLSVSMAGMYWIFCLADGPDIWCSLIEHYPHYERALRESLRGLVGKEVEGRVVVGLAKDGSGVGGEF